MIALLVVGFLMLALLQMPNMVRKSWWRELAVYTVLWSAGFILSVLIAIGVTLPPISTIIGKSITAMFGI